MFWDLYQQARIHQLQYDADEARRDSRKAQVSVEEMERQIASLQQQVDRLNLIAITLTEILRDRFGVPEGEIEEKLRQVDLRDGALDGRARREKQGPVSCPACSRTNAPNRTVCLYCGADLPVASPLAP